MRRFMLTALFALGLFGCDKPTESSCQKAIDNINKITGAPTTQETRPAVAQCRARSSKKVVQCMIDAKTEADVDACEAGK